MCSLVRTPACDRRGFGSPEWGRQARWGPVAAAARVWYRGGVLTIPEAGNGNYLFTTRRRFWRDWTTQCCEEAPTVTSFGEQGSAIGNGIAIDRLPTRFRGSTPGTRGWQPGLPAHPGSGVIRIEVGNLGFERRRPAGNPVAEGCPGPATA